MAEKMLTQMMQCFNTAQNNVGGRVLWRKVHITSSRLRNLLPHLEISDFFLSSSTGVPENSHSFHIKNSMISHFSLVLTPCVICI